MILEIKTTAQFNEVAERLFNENIHRLRKEMPVYYNMLMKDKNEMNRFCNIIIDMTKALFYEGHNEHTAYGLFKNINADRAKKHLKHLAFTYRYICKNAFPI